MTSITIANRPVGHTGFGLMGFAFLPAEGLSLDEIDARAFATMKAALAAGATFWNGGEFYGKVGGENSLSLLNRYFTKYPEDADKVFLSIKAGMTATMGVDGSPENMRACVDRCLAQLPPAVKKIDLFECARVDQQVPVETTVGALAELVREGKIGSIGLSECKAETVRRAAAVHAIAAVEVEVSMFETRNIDNGVLAACGELGIPVVAYGPLGGGFLAGRYRSPADMPANDPRRHMPRFSEENFPRNLELVEKVKAVASRKPCTPGQLALAWARSLNGEGKQGQPIVLPLPGASSKERAEENFADVRLTDEEAADIGKLLEELVPAGPRYPPAIARLSE